MFLLLVGACEVMAMFWPVGLALVAAWFAVWFAFAPRLPSPGVFFLRNCLPPFGPPAAILLCGAAFAHDPMSVGEGSNAAGLALLALVAAHLPLAVVQFYFLEQRGAGAGEKAAVLVTSALALFVSLCAFLVCGMAVSGTCL